MGKSRLGGVATALAPAQGSAPRQLALGISSPALAPVREDLLPGAVAEACGPDSASSYAPDAAIVNLYAAGAHLGLHLDGEEPSDAPVVTLSLGDTCVFRFAGVGRRNGPFTDVELRSGDLLVFGGPSRRIHHGVPKVFEGTAPADLGLPPGRVSITLRETGL
jgi:alkylated DNA repair protein (DNA oxidative demethylase)